MSHSSIYKKWKEVEKGTEKTCSDNSTTTTYVRIMHA